MQVLDYYVSPVILSMIVIGLTLWIVALWMTMRPPTKINKVYGYRTKRSMSSQAAWDFAQRNAANLLKQSGIGLIVVGMALFYMERYMPILALGFAVLCVTVGLIYPIYDTETQLKKRYS